MNTNSITLYLFKNFWWLIYASNMRNIIRVRAVAAKLQLKYALETVENRRVYDVYKW